MQEQPSIGARLPLATRLKQRWILILFALPFAGVGIGMLLFGVIPTLVDGQRMQAWHQGEARLTSAALDVNHGDDSTTYRARATYTYEYGGQRFNGDRVAIGGGSDNIGDFQRSLGNRLERAHARNEPVPVWINPEQPDEAVLNRDIRWGMIGFYLIFVVVFGGFGIALLAFTLLSQRGAVGTSTAAKPWQARGEWSSSEIDSTARGGMWFAWIFAVIWNAISLPAGIIGTQEFIDGNTAAILGWLFPLVGIGLLYWAIKATANWRRFGKTPLRMDPFPGAIGGHVGGTIDVNVPFDPNLAFKTALTCVYSHVSGSGKNRSRSERLVWQSEGLAHTRGHMGSTRLEILFNVDGNLPASDAERGSSYHLWRLQVSAELPGVDFDRSYEIPVFPSVERAKNLRQLCTEHPQASEHRLQAIERVLNITQVPGGVELFFPAFRHVGGKLVALIVGAIFVAAGFFIDQAGGPAAFLFVFGSLGGLIGLFAFLSLVTSLQVRIDRNGLRTHKRLLGIPAGGKTVPRGELRGLALKQSYSTSSGHKHTVYYTLKAVTQAGKAITVGKNLAGKEVAEQALESLTLLTGLPAVELARRRLQKAAAR